MVFMHTIILCEAVFVYKALLQDISGYIQDVSDLSACWNKALHAVENSTQQK